MSSIRAEEDNVHSIKDFIAELVAEADAAADQLQQATDRLRIHFHALKLAEDDKFLAETAEAVARVERGEVTFMTADDLRSRFARQ